MPKFTKRWSEISLNNKRVQCLPTARFYEGGMRRQSLNTDQKTTGPVEEYTNAYFECTIPHHAGVDRAELRAFIGGVFVCRTDTGVAWMIEDAFTADVGELSDGSFTLRVEGPEAVEL